MIAQGACGRADLLRAMAREDPAFLDAIADLLGYAPPADTTDKPSPDKGRSGLVRGRSGQPGTQSIRETRLAPTPFWRLEGYQTLTEGPPAEPPLIAVPVDWHREAKPDLRYRALAPWPMLQPRLRNAIAAQHPGGAYDWERIIRWLGEGRLLRRLPRLHRRGWGTRIQIIEDRSTRLTPYWRDQTLACLALTRLFPGYALDYYYLHDGQAEPRRPLGRPGPRHYTLPPEGSLVLILGDLGSLSREGSASRFWLQLGHRLREAGCRSLALLPCGSGRVHPRLQRDFEIFTWERPRRLVETDQPLEAQAQRLLRLVSPALRIEPGLLRAIRLAAGLAAGAEALVWQHPALISTHSVAATLDPKAAKGLRAEFAREPLADRQLALRCLRDWRTPLPDEIWFEEVVSLPPAARDALPVPGEYALACRFFERFSQQGRGMLAERISGARIAWFNRASRRLPDTTWNDPQIGPVLQRLEDHLHQVDPEYRADHAFDPVVIPPGDTPVRAVAVRQQADRLWFRYTDQDSDTHGSLLGILQSQNGLIRIEPITERTTDERLFWRAGRHPVWADDWGFDEYGAWASFSLPLPSGGKITQRLRWIASGEFLMGSSPDEPGRFDREGPQHRVTLTQGYWLFDTPCTQALWAAVMGNNPSRFKSPTRPVERVSWGDCQVFIERLNERIPDLDLSLPSEAQWEYACRAGTDTATYAGALEILGESNAPGLDLVAWYGGNSGVDFELEEGADSSSWSEKQYPHEKVGTHPVGLKQPNAWGLYDMLGNVDEWCIDGLRDYQDTPVKDPQGPLEDGGGRVFRGGSWSGSARVVRCSFRVAVGPGRRDFILGFRCARIQAGAEPVGTQQLQAERRTAAGTSGEAGRVDLRSRGEGSVVLSPVANGLRLRSDHTQLTLRRRFRPAWASAMGRDRFGLWAEIDLGEGQERHLVQRLRWIAPGEFMMGSPPDEPGRYENEDPQHRVTLTQGYWLFDTPCTQVLWEAVMGDNPSRFKSPTRPVEQVSWDDCQVFLERLNERIPDLWLSLPSEAQWEYACRAGTETATYAGPLEILGERNAPSLDPIAWYGGNSGVDFELENGVDSSEAKEKQYMFDKAGTHPVGLKRPNAWGLYDMLGNVFEWCEDEMQDYQDAPIQDVQGSTEVGGKRVIRGGSWGSVVRVIHCAFRGADDQNYHYNGLGFRCAG
jgi:formylglycine-generating enzyme required for sulfatase activity